MRGMRLALLVSAAFLAACQTAPSEAPAPAFTESARHPLDPLTARVRSVRPSKRRVRIRG